MQLTDHDLLQLDTDSLSRLDEESLRRLSGRLLADLKEARDRLNQTSKNSSRPPSSDSPYRPTKPNPNAEAAKSHEPIVTDGSSSDASPVTNPTDSSSAETTLPEAGKTTRRQKQFSSRKPGHQPGAPGHGRQQILKITGTVNHRPNECICCERPLPENAAGRAYGGYDEIDLLPSDPHTPGIVVLVTRHLPFEVICSCGHRTRYRSPQPEIRFEWQDAGVARQQMLGPRLASLIVLLSLRYRLSRTKLRELLHELIGVTLSTGLIDQTLRQSAGQVAPVEDALLEVIKNSPLLNVDETGWLEKGLSLWFWVLLAESAVVYVIGSRAREMFVNALPDGFVGWLMSDGYSVYRQYNNRLRCWAHLIRNAKGLAEATCRQIRETGGDLLGLMKQLMLNQIISTGTKADLFIQQQPEVERLKALCERHRQSSYDKLGAFCREILNDWEAITRPLYDPDLPLTNNAAERQLRHWVVARKTSFGTRSELGSRSLALLASIIDTCRLREASAWDYLTDAIRAGRAKQPMPALPMLRA